MKYLFVLYFISLLLLVESKVAVDKPVLKYNQDGYFKIVQFTDIHYGEDDDEDLQSMAIQDIILETEKPDFVAFSGDMLSGNEENFGNNSRYKWKWDQFTESCRKRNIPWGIIFGNHDGYGPWTTSQLMSLDLTYDLSLSQFGPRTMDGISNYVLEIQGSKSDEPKSLIYMFDSDTTSCQGEGWWGCIHPSQVEWYRNKSLTYQLPAISFVHIPPFEAIEQWNNNLVYGQFRDNGVCCYYTKDSGFISTMLELKDIKGLFYGHDHGCDYYGDYNGLTLGYGRKTGVGGYGSDLMHGARVHLIKESPYTLTSWIRNAKGDIEEQPRHDPNKQQALPLFCCTTSDRSNDKMWMIYIACFSGVAFIVYVLKIFGFINF